MKMILFATSIYMISITSGHATDGIIAFMGKVTDSTCKISNVGGPNFSVNLPTVSKTTLSAAGNVAGRTPFKISLSNCSITNVTAYFEPGNTVNASTGRLNNQIVPGAQNVQIQILNSVGQFIPIQAGGADGSQTNSEWVNIAVADSSADLTFAAEYYATGASTAGDVRTTVQYTLIYK